MHYFLRLQPRARTCCSFRVQELCESRGGRPGLPVLNSLYGLCGRKATLNDCSFRTQELCENRGGRPDESPVFAGHHASDDATAVVQN